jgi:hypothetical protein
MRYRRRTKPTTPRRWRASYAALEDVERRINNPERDTDRERRETENRNRYYNRNPEPDGVAALLNANPTRVPKHIIEGLVLEDVLPLGRPEWVQKGWDAQRWYGWVTDDDYEEIIDRRFLGIRY